MKKEDSVRSRGKKLSGIAVESDRLERIESKSGDPVFKWQGVWLESRYNPRRAAANRFDQFDLTGKKAALLFGDGGYYLAGMLAQSGLPVIVVEPVKELAAAVFANRSDLEELPVLPVWPEEIAAAGDWERYLPAGISPAELLVAEHPTAGKMFGKELKPPRRLLLEFFHRQIADLETTAWFGRRWLHNIVDNLVQLKETISLKSLQRNAVAVIAVPGPTLSSVLPDIKRYRDKIRLIALVPALPILQQAGLMPDLVCSMDGGFANLLHFTAELPQVPLVFPLYHCRGALHLWPGSLVPVTFGLPIEKLLLDRQKLPVLQEVPTVALFALQVAFAAGAREAVLAGQDFASDGARHHAPGYKFDEDRILLHSTRWNPSEKMLDIHWREEWERRDGFYTGKKLRLYRDELLNRTKEMPVAAWNCSPWLSRVPRWSVQQLQTVEMPAAEPVPVSEPFEPGGEAAAVTACLQRILEDWPQQIGNPAQFMDRVLEEPLLRPLFELLRSVELYTGEHGARQKAVEHFFSSELKQELAVIYQKLRLLLKRTG